MPSIHIPESVFERYSDEYGYTDAKEKVKEVVEKNAPAESE